MSFDAFVNMVTSRDFLIAALAAVSAAAVVFTLGFSFLGRGGVTVKQRIKRVALEREKMRAEEMSRLRGQGPQEAAHHSPRRRPRIHEATSSIASRCRRRSPTRAPPSTLARAGYRGQGALTTFVFLRFVTPFVLFVLSFAYLSLTVFKDNPLYMNALYALGVGVVGAYLPVLLLKNRTIKRQQSIRRAWPDALDLMLLCVEAGMSVEHAFKRVAKEIGLQSAELAEELTLTTAELSFLEDRTRAYDNLGQAHRPRRRQVGDDLAHPGRSLRHQRRHVAARHGRRRPRAAHDGCRKEGRLAAAEAHRAADPVLPAGAVHRHHLAGHHQDRHDGRLQLHGLTARLTAQKQKGPIGPLSHSSMCR